MDGPVGLVISASEPASAALLGYGTLLLAACRRRDDDEPELRLRFGRHPRFWGDGRFHSRREFFQVARNLHSPYLSALFTGP